MATSTDEILVKFTTEGGQEVVKTFKDVSDQSDQFHQKVSKAGGALGDLRLKSEGRVANNIGAIAQALTGGASAGEVFATTITKVSESFRGSLLFAGGAAVGLALYEGITKAEKAVADFHLELSSLQRESIKGADFLNTDSINQNLDITLTKLEDVRRTISSSKDFVEDKSAPLAGITQGVIGSLVHFFTGKGAEEEKQLQTDAVRFLDSLGEKQSRLNDIAREGLIGDEKQVALKKEENDHLIRAEGISARAAKARLSPQKTDELLAGEDAFTNLQNAAIEKRFSIQQRGLETQAKTIDIEKELLAPADENLKILDARIAGVQDLLDHQHNLTDQEREQLILQRGQLEATKERAQFTRNLEQDLADIELGRVRGGLSSDRAKINSVQRNADQARVFGQNSPEYERAEAGLEDEQFRQWEDYQKNPSAFRQRRINEQFERGRFEYARSHRQLPDEIASNGRNIRSPDEQRRNGEAGGKSGEDSLVRSVYALIKTIASIPEKIGVG